MSNMSYCRFQNTLKDLEECLEHFDDELLKEENEAREQMIEIIINFNR